ncbi:hypothetical protein D3C71_2011670 [compost metagenome]
MEAYIPELPAERMAVRMTAFITAAAAAKPARSNSRVNGETLMSVVSLRSRLGSVYGISMPMTKIARM